jgi:hypothetical protein
MKVCSPIGCYYDYVQFDLQVYLPAISGHVLKEMVQAFHTFLEFCYIVHRDVQDTSSLQQLEDALSCFHKHWTIFQECGVRPDGVSLPHQHSLIHYFHMIYAFGAPNGLCSSITESKHIKAVKKPWRCSNQFKALGQMLLINQRLDKLAASRADFTARGMLCGTVSQSVLLTLGELHLIYHDVPKFILDCKELQSQKPPGDDDADKSDDGEVPGPQTATSMKLGKAYGMYLHNLLFSYHLPLLL